MLFRAEAQSTLLSRYDSISSDTLQKETIRIFARLYCATKLSIDKGITEGDFSDTVFVQSFENCFATYFWNAIDSPNVRTVGWRMAYIGDTSNCTVLQKLLLAINAHINDDLLKTYIAMGQRYHIADYKVTAKRAGLRLVSVVDAVIGRYMQHYSEMSAYDKMQINIARKKIKRMIIRERNAIFDRYLEIATGTDIATVLSRQEKVSKRYATKVLHPKGLFRYFIKKLDRKYPMDKATLMNLIY